MSYRKDCVFCRIIKFDSIATFIYVWNDAIAIVPLNPVTPGHLLVIPFTHVKDATEDSKVFAKTMEHVAEIAEAPCNIITSVGREATQTIFHLHVHYIPRTENDSLLLPWSIGSAA